MNSDKVKLSNPGLYKSTQTTIPILAQIMIGVSFAMIAICIKLEFSNEIIWILNTKNIAISLFGFSGFSFWLTTESCINSQTWNYFSLEKEYRLYQNLSEDRAYVDDCMHFCKFWHRLAVILYRFGSLFLVSGVLLLLWPISRIVVLLIAALYILSFIFFLIYKYRQLQYMLRPKDNGVQNHLPRP